MREAMVLLKQPVYEGYPTEYLLARIRGRRARQISGLRPSGVEPSLSPASPAWRAAPGEPTATEAREKLRAECLWLYRQMNDGLRETFAPLFLWFELRTILLCVRFRRGGEREPAAGLLGASLLAERVQRVLTGAGEPVAVIDELAGLLAAVAGECHDLGKVYRQRGGRAWEERLVTVCLERLTAPPLHPVLREFFRALVDAINLAALAKQLRWQLQVPPAFVRGGEIAPERLAKVAAEGSPTGFATLIASLPGMGRLPAVPSNPEPLLFAWLTRRVRKLAREPRGIGLIVDYLWNYVVEARNTGLIFHGAALERATVQAELIG